jgi:hypothetical protein
MGKNRKKPANKKSDHYNSVLDPNPVERKEGRVEGLTVYEQAYSKGPR